MSSRADFDNATTADQVLEGIDLTGRKILITGGTSGLGAEAARAFASKGAQVILTARTVEKGEPVAERIRSAYPRARVQVFALELGDQASVKDAAAAVLAVHESIDVLVNNAGVMACPQGETKDGFELQLGVNHLGHFTFTNLLMPALLRGDRPRVVNVSSRAHFRSAVHLDDLFFERRPYEKWASYGQSKTANILFSVELERRFAQQGLHAYAIHPGVIKTELVRHLDDGEFAGIEQMVKAGGMRLKSVEEGAATQVFTATAPELEGKGGVYLEDCSISDVVDTQTVPRGVQAYAVDGEVAKQLWTRSEELVGRSFS